MTVAWSPLLIVVLVVLHGYSIREVGTGASFFFYAYKFFVSLALDLFSLLSAIPSVRAAPPCCHHSHLKKSAILVCFSHPCFPFPRFNLASKIIRVSDLIYTLLHLTDNIPRLWKRIFFAIQTFKQLFLQFCCSLSEKILSAYRK